MRNLCLLPCALLLVLGCNKSSSSAADSPSSAAPGAGSGGAAQAPAAGGGGVLGAMKSALSPSSAFEGEMTLQVIDAKHPAPQTMNIQFKGSKIRFNADAKAGGHVGSGIMDLKAKKMLTIMDQQKKYMEFDFGAGNPMAAMGHPGMPGAMPGMPAANPGAPVTPPKIDKTGKHESVAGHDCEDWNINDADGRHGTVCMAKDLGGLDFVGLSGGLPFAPSFLTGGTFEGTEFPLKFVDYDAQNKETMRAEITKIDKKSEDDSVFSPPPGYTKLDLGNLGAFGAMGGHGGPGMPPGMPH